MFSKHDTKKMNGVKSAVACGVSAILALPMGYVPGAAQAYAAVANTAETSLQDTLSIKNDDYVKEAPTIKTTSTKRVNNTNDTAEQEQKKLNWEVAVEETELDATSSTDTAYAPPLEEDALDSFSGGAGTTNKAPGGSALSGPDIITSMPQSSGTGFSTTSGDKSTTSGSVKQPATSSKAPSANSSPAVKEKDDVPDSTISKAIVNVVIDEFSKQATPTKPGYITLKDDGTCNLNNNNTIYISSNVSTETFGADMKIILDDMNLTAFLYDTQIKRDIGKAEMDNVYSGRVFQDCTFPLEANSADAEHSLSIQTEPTDTPETTLGIESEPSDTPSSNLVNGENGSAAAAGTSSGEHVHNWNLSENATNGYKILACSSCGNMTSTHGANGKVQDNADCSHMWKLVAMSDSRNYSVQECSKCGQYSVGTTATTKSLSYGTEWMNMDIAKERVTAILPTKQQELGEIRVAVFDTGVNLGDDSTPELKALFENRVCKYEDSGYTIKYNAFGATEGMKMFGSDVANDTNGHGTAVASTIVNSTPANTKIIPVNVVGNITATQLYQAYQFAIKQNVDIINMSYGFFDPTPQQEIAYTNCVQPALAAGIICVSASGNHDTDNIKSTAKSKFLPACLNGIVDVSALTKVLGTDGQPLSSLSNTQKTHIDTDYSTEIAETNREYSFCAPGDGIRSYGMDGTIVEKTGTSSAAPFISSALVYAKMLTNLEVPSANALTKKNETINKVIASASMEYIADDENAAVYGRGLPDVDAYAKLFSNYVTTYYVQFKGLNNETVPVVVNGQSVNVQQVEHGRAAVVPALPQKSETDPEGTIIEWDKPTENITGDTIITAVKKVPLSFEGSTSGVDVSYLGTQVEETIENFDESTGYGVSATPEFSTMSTPSDTPEFNIITEEPSKYTVTFVDGVTGNTIHVANVKKGKAAKAPTPPDHTGDKQSMVFEQWDKDFSNVTENMIVIAQYKTNLDTVVVTFVDTCPDANNTEHEIVVRKGDNIAIAPAPVHDGYTCTGYSTDDWKSPQQNMRVKILYEKVKTFMPLTLRFVVDDKQFGDVVTLDPNYDSSSTLQSELVKKINEFEKEYNDTKTLEAFKLASVDGTESLSVDFIKTATAKEFYAAAKKCFVSYDQWTAVSFTMDATAIYVVPEEITKEHYTVTFIDGQTKDVIAEESVKGGSNAAVPVAPVHDGYEFAGWEGVYNAVTNDKVVVAKYDAKPAEETETYQVVFKDSLNNDTVSSQTIAKNSSASQPTAPTHDGYKFSGWSEDTSNITGDKVVVANYVPDDNVDAKLVETAARDQKQNEAKAKSEQDTPLIQTGDAAPIGAGVLVFVAGLVVLAVVVRRKTSE